MGNRLVLLQQFPSEILSEECTSRMGKVFASIVDSAIELSRREFAHRSYLQLQEEARSALLGLLRRQASKNALRRASVFLQSCLEVEVSLAPRKSRPYSLSLDQASSLIRPLLYGLLRRYSVALASLLAESCFRALLPLLCKRHGPAIPASEAWPLVSSWISTIPSAKTIKTILRGGKRRNSKRTSIVDFCLAQEASLEKQLRTLIFHRSKTQPKLIAAGPAAESVTPLPHIPLGMPRAKVQSILGSPSLPRRAMRRKVFFRLALGRKELHEFRRLRVRRLQHRLGVKPRENVRLRLRRLENMWRLRMKRLPKPILKDLRTLKGL